jgi:ubiquinone biosynthesis accessory factor UbiK
MFDSKSIDSIADKIANAVPPGLNQFKDEIEKHVHALFQSTLTKLDLVSREEFEVQKAVLAKTRDRLETLEKQLAELEQHLQPKP